MAQMPNRNILSGLVAILRLLLFTLFLIADETKTGIMSSGIDIDEESLRVFQEMKIPDHSKPRNRCVIYKISDDKKKIEVERIIKSDPEKDQETEYNEIIKTLPPNEGRYIVWDLKIPNPKSGKENEKLIFMSWSPDNAPVSSRMIFASSKDAIKKKLVGIGTAIDCSDLSDTTYKEVIAKTAH